MSGPRARRRWGRRAAAVGTGWLLLMVVRVQTAAAASVTADDKLGQTPPALSWIALTDSRGISMWNFELSVDRGGLTSPDKFFWAAITDSAWGAYRSWCALALWFLDWVLSFEWVQTIATPLMAVGTSMQQVVTRLGVVPTFLTLTALLGGLWMLKGRHTTAIWEVGIACVIAALASGVFASPVAMIAGQDGYIVRAHQTGQELAAALATGQAAGQSAEQLRRAQTGQLVDTFIRAPTQMINFGRVLDGGPCEGAYNDVTRAGPYGNEARIRDKIAGCDKTLGDYAGTPSASMALGSLVFFPAAFVILTMCLVLGGSVIAAAVWAMFQSLKLIVTTVTGLLPGGGRGSLMLTAAETLVALLIIVFTSVFLSVFLLVIQGMFTAGSGQSVPRTFVIVDILLVVGIVVYLRQRRQLRTAAARLAQWASRRPGGAPATRLPQRPSSGALGGGATRAAALGIGLMHARARMLDARKPPPLSVTTIDHRHVQAVFIGGGPRPGDDGPSPHFEVVPTPRPGGPGEPPALPAGPGGPPALPAGPGGPPPPPAPGSGGRKKIGTGTKVVGALVRAGTSAALASATGGASTAVTGAAKVASVGKAARRAALTSKLATGGAGQRTGNAGPQSPRIKPAPPAAYPQRPSRAARAVLPGQVLSSSSSTPPASTAAPPDKGPVPAAGRTSPAPGTKPAASGQPGPPRTPPAGKAPTRATPPASGPRPQNAARADQLRQRLSERTRTRRSA